MPSPGDRTHAHRRVLLITVRWHIFILIRTFTSSLTSSSSIWPFYALASGVFVFAADAAAARAAYAPGLPRRARLCSWRGAAALATTRVRDPAFAIDIGIILSGVPSSRSCAPPARLQP